MAFDRRRARFQAPYRKRPDDHTKGRSASPPAMMMMMMMMMMIMMVRPVTSMPGQQQQSQQPHTCSRCRHHRNAACLSGQKPAFIVKLTTLKCLFCYNSQRKLRCEVTPDLALCSPEHIHVQGIWEFSKITGTLVWVRILLFRLLY